MKLCKNWPTMYRTVWVRLYALDKVSPAMKALESLEFSEPTRESVCSNIKGFADERQPLGDFRTAAVALTIVRDGSEAALILTRRSASLRAHGGQWSLPGGRIDAGETPYEAALRELREEVNLELKESDILGTLDDYTTRSGFRITPVVIWADADPGELRANPDEVASIHTFTFSELGRPDSPHLESIEQSEQPVLSMHYDDDRIFAPTGAMLYQFREVAIMGKPTRVSHYDQPVFAWR
jgi:mutator protein MutT